MGPRDFLAVAAELVRVGRPAYCRTAVGRAYYSTFNFAAEILRKAGFTIGKGPQGHGDAVKHLLGCSDAMVRRSGSQIDDLRAMRNKADYRMDATDVEDSKTAEALVTGADRVMTALEGAFSGAARAAVLTSIQEWKRKAGVP
jgi:hypothetical protein